MAVKQNNLFTRIYNANTNFVDLYRRWRYKNQAAFNLTINSPAQKDCEASTDCDNLCCYNKKCTEIRVPESLSGLSSEDRDNAKKKCNSTVSTTKEKNSWQLYNFKVPLTLEERRVMESCFRGEPESETLSLLGLPVNYSSDPESHKASYLDMLMRKGVQIGMFSNAKQKVFNSSKALALRHIYQYCRNYGRKLVVLTHFEGECGVQGLRKIFEHMKLHDSTVTMPQEHAPYDRYVIITSDMNNIEQRLTNFTDDFNNKVLILYGIAEGLNILKTHVMVILESSPDPAGRTQEMARVLRRSQFDDTIDMKLPDASSSSSPNLLDLEKQKIEQKNQQFVKDLRKVRIICLISTVDQSDTFYTKVANAISEIPLSLLLLFFVGTWGTFGKGFVKLFSQYSGFSGAREREQQAVLKGLRRVDSLKGIGDKTLTKGVTRMISALVKGDTTLIGTSFVQQLLLKPTLLLIVLQQLLKLILSKDATITSVARKMEKVLSRRNEGRYVAARASLLDTDIEPDESRLSTTPDETMERQRNNKTKLLQEFDSYLKNTTEIKDNTELAAELNQLLALNEIDEVNKNSLESDLQITPTQRLAWQKARNTNGLLLYMKPGSGKSLTAWLVILSWIRNKKFEVENFLYVTMQGTEGSFIKDGLKLSIILKLLQKDEQKEEKMNIYKNVFKKPDLFFDEDTQNLNGQQIEERRLIRQSIRQYLTETDGEAKTIFTMIDPAKHNILYWSSRDFGEKTQSFFDKASSEPNKSLQIFDEVHNSLRQDDTLKGQTHNQRLKFLQQAAYLADMETRTILMTGTFISMENLCALISIIKLPSEQMKIDNRRTNTSQRFLMTPQQSQQRYCYVSPGDMFMREILLDRLLPLMKVCLPFIEWYSGNNPITPVLGVSTVAVAAIYEGKNFEKDSLKWYNKNIYSDYHDNLVYEGDFMGTTQPDPDILWKDPNTILEKYVNFKTDVRQYQDPLSSSNDTPV